MNTRMLTHPAAICNFRIAVSEQPIYASSRDYGFDFNEEELAGDLLAPLPASEPTHEVDADEFESRYLWFVS
ncbi:MAG: hypothetical protein HZB19_17460 [Chloroflexi bacterium]|nr:hypothetical protein [Chloroflexota bacterium]